MLAKAAKFLLLLLFFCILWRNVTAKEKPKDKCMDSKPKTFCGVLDRMTSITFFLKSPETLDGWKKWEILGSKEIQLVTEFQNLSTYQTNHEENNECYMDMIIDCSLSQKCAELLMNDRAILTTLGHNARFFELAVRLECVKEVDFVEKFRKLGTNWDEVLEAQVTAMWNEANIIATTGFRTGYKGLFLLHAFSCSVFGYPNFFKVEWMNRIMSWMDATQNGCIAPDTKSGTGDTTRKFDDVAGDGEWCSIYETSMAVQILVTYLRYVLQTCG